MSIQYTVYPRGVSQPEHVKGLLPRFLFLPCRLFLPSFSFHLNPAKLAKHQVRSAIKSADPTPWGQGVTVDVSPKP